MVRLKEADCPLTAFDVYKFQFQYGSIKSTQIETFPNAGEVISIPIWFD